MNSRKIDISKEVEKANQKHIETLFRLLNAMLNDELYTRQLVDHLKREHRTLQQNFFRMISEIVKEMAKQRDCDLRNEASIEWCKKATQATQDIRFPFI